MTEQCITKVASSSRSVGIFILLWRNHSPIISIKITIITEIISCTVTEVENIFFKRSMLLVPNSTVINLLIDDEREEVMIPNIATIPPTTL